MVLYNRSLSFVEGTVLSRRSAELIDLARINIKRHDWRILNYAYTEDDHTIKSLRKQFQA